MGVFVSRVREHIWDKFHFKIAGDKDSPKRAGNQDKKGRIGWAAPYIQRIKAKG